MESFLEQASIFGRVFEIAVQRGVLEKLVHQGLLDSNHPVLKPWQTIRNADLYNHLIKALNLTDPNAKEWTGTMLRHLLVLGYGLGWTAMRECLKHNPVRKPKLKAIWCPLTLPGVQAQRDAEVEQTARAFHSAFALPGPTDLALVRRGQPARADFLLWLSNSRSEGFHPETKDSMLTQRQVSLPEGNNFSGYSGMPLSTCLSTGADRYPKRGLSAISQNSSRGKERHRQTFDHFVLCLEFSYNAPAKLADFSTESPHQQEINRYARYIDSRGAFSRVCAEVDGEEFLLSDNLAKHLSVFSSSDKPLFKLCQASSYTERLVHLLRSQQQLQGACSTRALAVTPNGFESLAAHLAGQSPEPDPRARLMQSLGLAYRDVRQLNDDVPGELEREIRLVFNKLVRALPRDFKEQAQQLSSGENFDYLFQETVEGFHHPMQPISRERALDAVEETEELTDFFCSSPKSKVAEALNRQDSQISLFPLREIHAAAVVAGLRSAQAGRLNVIALLGNPGIGKTTAVIDFLKQQTEGYLFLYLSPRVVINRDVMTKLAREKNAASGILTLTTNAKLITSARQWYEQQMQLDQGWPDRYIDSAVVVDGVSVFQSPTCNTVFISPEQEHEIDCDVVVSKRFKQSRNEREDSVESSGHPGVLRTLASSARKLLEENPQVNRLVMTAAIQGYRSIKGKTTVEALSHLFTKKADKTPGRGERQAFSQRIPTIIVMVDELAGDGAGAPLAHELAEWLHQQFIAPFEGMQSPFRVILIISDASLSNEIVLNSYLNSGERAPDKVLISKSQGEAPFRVTGTYTKVGSKKHPTLHVMTNSYPATELKLDYSIRLSPITPGLTQDGKKQGIRQAIRSQMGDELLANAYREIQRGLKQNAEQLIFFAQDKAFLRQLREKLVSGTDALLPSQQVAVLDQSVKEQERVALIQEPRRDQVRVFLMTSSGARGISFPKTDWIIASVPRFNIEAALMEIAQLIYRGRGMYTNPETGRLVSGDDKARRLVMLINDFIIIDEVDEEIERSRLWLRQASDLLTLLVMLRSTINTRIKGDAGLKRQKIAFVPVGFVGDEELLNLMSDDVQDFLREAQVFICDSHSADAKGTVKKAEQLVNKIFAQFNLTGQSKDRNICSYTSYQNLEAHALGVSRRPSWLVPSLENEALIIPDYLSCIGPFWLEDCSGRQMEERFNFEGWQADAQVSRSKLLGLLQQIGEHLEFPSKIRRPAKELYKLLIREKSESTREYSTLQAMKTDNVVVSLPLDYPHFLSNQKDKVESSIRASVLEEPEIWRNALGRTLTPQGLVTPVISQYQSFPWAAVAGRRVYTQLETIFDDRYFMASSELNLLNTILLEDEESQ